MPTLPLWLLNLGRAGQGLFRGSGWGRGARGTEGIPGTEGILGRGTRVGPGIGPTGTRGTVRRPTPVGERGIRTVGQPGTPPLPPGWARQHPYKAGAVGGAGLATLPLFMGGGEEEQVPQVAYDTSGYSDWQPPQDLDSYIQHQEKRTARTRKMMAKIMQQYMVVSFTGGKEAAKAYLEMADKLMKADEGFSSDTRGAELYAAVFGDKNNLPSNSEETYNRFIVAGAAPEHAAEMSGYIGEAKKADVAAVGKQSTRERVLEQIRQIYAADSDMGIRALVEAWMTGTLDEKPVGDYETLLQKAAEVLSGIPASESSGGSGITSLRMA